MAENQSFWGVVEVMGHNRFSGMISEVVLAGSGFLRVDVPEVINRRGVRVAAYSKLIAPSAVYAITPTTEEIATAAAAATYNPPLESLGIMPATIGDRQLAFDDEDEDMEDEDG